MDSDMQFLGRQQGDRDIAVDVTCQSRTAAWYSGGDEHPYDEHPYTVTGVSWTSGEDCRSVIVRQPNGADRDLTLLDAGVLPVEDLAVLCRREGRRPRPIYGAHRWFARRFGTAFRALLTAAALPLGSDFWAGYYGSVDWDGRTILDPFVGGGTSVVEAQRLGANVIGIDVDAVACAITRFETKAGAIPDLQPSLERLKRDVSTTVAPHYRTRLADGQECDVLHYFWVQVVPCEGCGRRIEAHPHYQLAHEAEGTRQWVICPVCRTIEIVDRDDTQLRCKQCGVVTGIKLGTVRFGRLTCPYCGVRERLIDVAARTSKPPEWKLFALETIDAASTGARVPLAQRRFHPASEYDELVYRAASEALGSRRQVDDSIAWIPDRVIPRENRSDDRILRYGYRFYHQLFNSRQLLHLSHLAAAIASMEGPEREAFALAFSNHLRTNCMMTHYAFGWRRLAPLFTVRAFRHVTRPVEINPWLDGIGRGTFPNAVRQVQQAIEFARAPKEPHIDGGFRAVPNEGAHGESAHFERVQIQHRNAQSLDFLPDESIDLVLTDPPYFDNIAYSELSDFFVPWLQQFELVPNDDTACIGYLENMAAKGRDDQDAQEFERSLALCFREIARVLKPAGRLVFTFQHQTDRAWYVLARVMARSGLRPVQLIPLLGDSGKGIHHHSGNSTWDAVYVAIKDPCPRARPSLSLSSATREAAERHWRTWTTRLEASPDCQFRDADQLNFYRACLIAAALGMFSDMQSSSSKYDLASLLQMGLPENRKAGSCRD